MELRHLRYFVAVAEELNFRRAAERLLMAQPPLSQQIHNLEAELGVELFYRTHRTVQLTTAGRVFLADAYKILSETDQAERRVKRAGKGELGQLTIGYTSLTYNPLIPCSASIVCAIQK
jgi:DNA-binding transcriptional LysR family regulator